MDDYDYDELKGTQIYQEAIKGHKDKFALIEERLKLLEEKTGIASTGIKCLCDWCNGKYDIQRAKAEIDKKRNKPA